jgi:hypothetical protein
MFTNGSTAIEFWSNVVVASDGRRTSQPAKATTLITAAEVTLTHILRRAGQTGMVPLAPEVIEPSASANSAAVA